MPAGVGYSPMQRAFMGGGAAGAPSPFRAPAGIPDSRGGVVQGQTPPPPSPDVQGLLRSGALSAEQLLALVAQLAGLGQAPQVSQPRGEMMSAFFGG